MVDSVKIEGLDDAINAIRELPKKLRFSTIRKALRAAGNVFKAEAKQRAPVLQRPVPHRIAGVVRKSITVKSSKLARRRGDLGAFVTVARPANAKAIGAYSRLSDQKKISPNDPFYFKFLEKGTKKMRAQPFISAAFNAKGNAAVSAFTAEIHKQIAVENSRR